jgi:KTSC domain
VPPVEWTEVKSSAVESLGYDPAVRALYVKWAGGKVYRHDDVQDGTLTALAVARSVGAACNVFKAENPGVRVDPDTLDPV